MGKVFLIILYSSIIYGSFCIKHFSMASESICREPFVWIKGCHRQPGPEMVIKTVSVIHNAPGACFQSCGASTQIIALQLNTCACLMTDSSPKVALAESQCNTPCVGDNNMKCGGITRSTWSVYQRVSEIVIQSMKILPNATGCGVASSSSNSYSYEMVSCNTFKSLVCLNMVTGCEDVFGVYTWNEAISECEMYTSVLPYETICQTSTSVNSYWIGLYRPTEFSETCETTTLPVQSSSKPTNTRIPEQFFTKQPTEPMETRVSEQLFINQSIEPTGTRISEQIFTKQSIEPTGTRIPGQFSTNQSTEPTGTRMSGQFFTKQYIVPTGTRIPGQFSTNQSTESTETRISEQFFTKQSIEPTGTRIPGQFSTNQSTEPTGTRISEHSFTKQSIEPTGTRIPVQFSTNQSSEPTGTRISEQFFTEQSIEPTGTRIPGQFSTNHSAEPTETRVSEQFFTKETTETRILGQFFTKHSNIPKESLTHIEQSGSSYFTTVSSTDHSISSSADSSASKRHTPYLLTTASTSAPTGIVPNVLATPTTKQLEQTLTFTETKPTSAATFVANTKSELGDVEVTARDSEKLTVTVSVIGSVVSTLLLAIFLMLCRISRILQKLHHENMNRPPNKKHHRIGNFSYLTDGSSSYPLSGGMLSGKQHAPFPYSGLYGYYNRSPERLRERASNMYGGWYDRRDTRRESTRGLTSDLNSHYSETWEGRIDDYMSSEDEERYHELTRIRTTNNDAHNIV